MSLSTRVLQPEVMDDPGLERRRHRQALQALARINSLSRSAHLLWPAIRRLATRVDRPLRVLDIATGGGDVPVRLARLAARQGIRLELSACDTSRRALAVARLRARRAGVSLELLQQDITRQPLTQQYDVVMCSLFLHHLSQPHALQLLEQMRTAARELVLVNDLRRSPAGYAIAWTVTRCLTRSDVVHTDGPLSVQAAFTIDEIQQLARQAGLAEARVTPRWPWRFLLEWRKR